MERFRAFKLSPYSPSVCILFSAQIISLTPEKDDLGNVPSDTKVHQTMIVLTANVRTGFLSTWDIYL